MYLFQYGDTIARYYYERSIWGRLARGCFASPTLYNVIEKVAPGRQIKRVKYLPPRVNLRPLGTYFNVFVLTVLMILSYLYGFNPVWILAAFLLLFFLRTLFYAVLEKNDKVDELMSKYGRFIHDDDDVLSD